MRMSAGEHRRAGIAKGSIEILRARRRKQVFHVGPR